MATVRIVVWFLIAGNTMLKASDQPTAQEAGRNLLLYIGAGCLTWILFRLPVVFRRIWQLMRKYRADEASLLITFDLVDT